MFFAYFIKIILYKCMFYIHLYSAQIFVVDGALCKNYVVIIIKSTFSHQWLTWNVVSNWKVLVISSMSWRLTSLIALKGLN